jgi:protein-disulfide isomerase
MAVSARGSRRRTAARGRDARRRSRWLFILVGAAAVAAVAGLIAMQAFGSESATVPERVATGEGRVLGDANAPVTVIEYADFQCPVCKRAVSSVVSKIEADYVQQGQVKIEFRMFPFIGQESFNAAQAAEAARDQGKFWEYHDALFNAQGRENGGAFAYENLVELAREVGLDVALFEQTLGDNVHLESVQAEADAARDAGIESTPTFFVNGKKIVGAQPYEDFQAAIDGALEEAAQ